MSRTRVFNGNNNFNVFKGYDCVYTGNSRFIAFLYAILQNVAPDKYYVGDTRWQKK